MPIKAKMNISTKWYLIVAELARPDASQAAQFKTEARYLGEASETHRHAGPKQAHCVPFKHRSQS